jgi:pimeloyl-ACP methyl ester carboxylesterase
MLLFGVDRGPIDLLGHSMGGNVAMLYSGVRPDRVRRLVNLEGFGMPRSRPEQAPKRVAFWLVSLKKEETLRPYESLEAVAARLQKTNPLLRSDRAHWLAATGPRRVPGENGEADTWHLLADPNHKRSSPIMANVDEWLEFWKRITAPVLWIEGDRTDVGRLVGRPLHQGRVPRTAEPRASGRAARRRPRPATCCTTTSRKTSPASWNRSSADRAAALFLRQSAPFERDSPWTWNTSMPSAIGSPT